MSNTDKSQPKAPVHVSLTKWSTVRSAIASISAAVGVELNPLDYEDRLAVRNDNGLLTMNLVSLSTGELDWVIIDRYSTNSDTDQSEFITNPKAFAFDQVTKSFGVLINTEAELAFLKDVRLDVRYDSGLVGADKSLKLMNLLNAYNIGDGWTSNPSNGCTTAYFVLRYFGSGANAPDVYNFNPNAKLVAVVELMMYGVYETHALVVR
ncbi:putative flagellar biosynthesis protein [Kosakonia phage Kc263]|uniref:Flagellar biosynthesis protein n=1 Tax=Kosakonia phage Kc263 TaxID=2863194 RepID=A0AAE7WFP5_9CAUD|nr:putative flagellar biosynthesis protein [Kosakonia phage Kc263]QYN79960.1 putative flagellar biosynthesis protein [Kosakonia phage Kc263]